MNTISLNPLLELEEENYTITLTILEKSNSVFNETEHNNVFTIYISAYWEDPESIQNY